jgi:hypothetical protein
MLFLLKAKLCGSLLGDPMVASFFPQCRPHRI